MSYRPATVQGAKCRKDWESTSRLDPDSVPVGGGGAWPGFEATRRAKLAARPARGRATAHGAARPNRAHAAPGTPAAPATPQPMFHVKHLPNHRPRYPVWPGKWHT